MPHARTATSFRTLLMFVAAAGCAPTEPPSGTKLGEFNGLSACTDAAAKAEPGQNCRTWRAVAGISMGGGAAAQIGLTHPELFDVVADIGGPISDLPFFVHMLEQNQFAGACSLEALEAAVAANVDLDDPDNASIWCGVHDVWPAQGQVSDEQSSSPLGACAMFRSDFNHWYRGPAAGRGGDFARSNFIASVSDLTAVYGNLLTHNPEDPYLPPGVPRAWQALPDADEDISVRCDNPIVVPGIFNREYNPRGIYNMVTFCDGTAPPLDGLDEVSQDQRRGIAVPGVKSRVVDFALAVDINGNGRRDYAEPILRNNRERFTDVGVDGIANGAAGDDDDDNFHNLLQPFGTEGNGWRDDGEPYDDDGLDGVPGTGDYGEGNGKYDVAPLLDAALSNAPSQHLNRLSAPQKERISIWLDAGVRDFFNTAQSTNMLFAAAEKALGGAAFDNYQTLPGAESPYRFYDVDYSRSAMPAVSYLRYGDPTICPDSDDVHGQGNHAGTDEAVDRIASAFGYISARMPAQGRDTSIGGTIEDFDSPTGSISDFIFTTNYTSDILERDSKYGILLPPDYFFNPKETYPVIYFFHGQGMTVETIVAIGVAIFGPMTTSSRPDRISAQQTDLQRSIIVWADGACDEGECYSGNFYANFVGRPDEKHQFEDVVYELMRHIEATYRVKKPSFVKPSELQ